MTPDECIREMWTIELASTEDGYVQFDAASDQWWVVFVQCSHSDVHYKHDAPVASYSCARGPSNGPMDVSSAFERALEEFRRYHEALA